MCTERASQNSQSRRRRRRLRRPQRRRSEELVYSEGIVPGPGLFDTGTFYFEPQSIDGVTEEDFERCRWLSMRFHNAGALHRPVWNLRLQPHNISMK